MLLNPKIGKPLTTEVIMENSQTYSKRIINLSLNIARQYAQQSRASRMQAGCLIIKNGRPVTGGYNGTPSGYDNVCEDEEGNTRPEVIHAEANAIADAARFGKATDGCEIVITHSTCYECAKLIIQAGIKTVYYEREYRLREPKEFLEENNIKVIKIGD
jgi:dCMP deaminase